MKFEVGQIYFWYDTTSIFGEAIDYYNKKKFGRSDTTHCGIIVGVDKDYVHIAEAGGKGFSINPYEKWWLEARIKDGKVKIGECKEPLKNVYENAQKYLNIGYGWLDIVGIGLSLITGFKFGLTGKNKIICSEAVNYVIYDSSKKINFAKEYNISPDKVTPEHIFLSKQVKIL